MWRVPVHFPAENRVSEFLFSPSDEGVDGACIAEAPDASFEAGCDAVGTCISRRSLNVVRALRLERVNSAHPPKWSRS